MNPWIALLMYWLAVVTDASWAKYTDAIHSKNPWIAALFAVIIVAVGSAYVHAYLLSRWYAIPIALGAGTGTFIVVWSKRRKDD